MQYSDVQLITPTAIALGNFDGIHLGHQDVLTPILNHPGCCPTVITFEPHPREFFSGQKHKLLTPSAEKIARFKELGVVQVITLPFDAQLANLSAIEFVKQILVNNFDARFISVGEDFCFGHQRQGKAKDLQKIGSSLGVQVLVSKLKKQAKRISSSQIRHYLDIGEIQLANDMLGRCYSLNGMVIHGEHIGKSLGYPTANLEIPPEKLLPRYGVYSVKLQIGNKQCYGVVNIGIRPTLEGKKESVEVHIFDWNEDIYGQSLTISLENFLRAEMRFDSLIELRDQITKDCQRAKELMKTAAFLI